jgi:hypothetical protein
MPSTMTYNSLVSDIENYTERTDTTFVNQIPRFIMMGEWRIATDLKGLGYLQVEQSSFTAGNPIVQKPSFWRESVSFSYNTGSAIVPLLPRTYEYARNYWPQVTGTAPPRFYSELDWNTWFITPTPDQNYSFEVLSYVRVQPLDSSSQTSWLTINAPQLLLYACMLEAELFLKNYEKAASYEMQYKNALSSLNREDLRRPKDRSAIVLNEP